MMALSAVVAGSAQAELVRTGYTSIVAASTGKCVGITGGSTTPGTASVQWRCNGAADQQWTVRPLNGGYQIVDQSSGQCLWPSAGSTSSGTPARAEHLFGGQRRVVDVQSERQRIPVGFEEQRAVRKHQWRRHRRRDGPRSVGVQHGLELRFHVPVGADGPGHAAPLSGGSQRPVLERRRQQHRRGCEHRPVALLREAQTNSGVWLLLGMPIR